MTEQEKTDFTPVAIECDEPQGMIQIKVPDDDKYGTSPRFDARRTYNDKESNDIRFTKNGLNLPADKLLPWIDVMLEAYNQAFGTELMVTEERLTIDAHDADKEPGLQ